MPFAKRGAQDDSQLVGGKKIRVVRGGGICQKGDKPSMARGTMHTMVCLPTTGRDPRPRWQEPGGGTAGAHGTRGSTGSHAHKTTLGAKTRVTQRK